MPWRTMWARSSRSRCSACTRSRGCACTWPSWALRPARRTEPMAPPSAADRVRIAAHAKLNLFLRILARESPAGYHQIETAFALLELADDLVGTRTASGGGRGGGGRGAPAAPRARRVAPGENPRVRAAPAVLEATGPKV